MCFTTFIVFVCVCVCFDETIFNDKDNERTHRRNENLQRKKQIQILKKNCSHLGNIRIGIANHFTIYPQIKSLNLDKTPKIRGVLQGIKGQYLIFDIGVINIRKYTGYELIVRA